MFTDVETLRYWTLKVLPLVYDDSLSYMEVQGKIVKKLNELIKNNNELPKYLRELIKTYISSGEIDNIIAEILSDYMLSVKNPPENLKPAVGDGSADDTEAIQGCLEYAKAHNGMCVYFPSGAYLTGTLTLPENSDVTMFGQGRYVTRLVLRGGVTEPMLKGNVNTLTLTGLTFDGNGDIQVNNVDLIECTGVNISISQCILTDGFTLAKLTSSNNIQISHTVFDHAIKNALTISGTGDSNCSDVTFNSISTLVGKEFIKLDSDNNVIICTVTSDATKLLTINGNDNYVEINGVRNYTTYVDNGQNNIVKIARSVYKGSIKQLDIRGENANISYTKSVLNGQTKTENYTSDVSLNTKGKLKNECKTIEEIVNGDSTKSGVNLTENYSGDVTTTGVNKTEEFQGDYFISGVNKIETFTGDITTNAKSNTETYTSDVDVEANIHTIKTKTSKVEIGIQKNVRYTGSVNNEYGSVSETVTGNSTENCNTKTINASLIDLNSTNPMKYKTPVQLETTEFFSYIPMQDRNGNIVKVLTANNKTPLISSTIANNVLIIGDSYAEGYTPDGNVKGFPTLMGEYAGWTEDVDFWKQYAGGAGFVSVGSLGKNFKDLITDAFNRMTDTQRLSIKKILIAGGWNDAVSSTASITTAIKGTIESAKQMFKNAEIYIAMIGWSGNYDKREQIVKNVIPAYTRCGKYGAKYITNSEYIMHNYGGFASDNNHPNSENQDLLATYLLDGIRSGSCDVQYKQNLPYHVNSATATSIPSLGEICMSNGTITWNVGRFYINFANIHIGGGEIPVIATVDNDCLVRGGKTESNMFGGVVSGYIQKKETPDIFYEFNGAITIDNGEVRLSFNNINGDHNGYKEFNNVTFARLDMGTICCTSLSC
jgi:hypothetical protein